MRQFCLSCPSPSCSRARQSCSGLSNPCLCQQRDAVDRDSLGRNAGRRRSSTWWEKTPCLLQSHVRTRDLSEVPEWHVELQPMNAGLPLPSPRQSALPSGPPLSHRHLPQKPSCPRAPRWHSPILHHLATSHHSCHHTGPRWRHPTNHQKVRLLLQTWPHGSLKETNHQHGDVRPIGRPRESAVPW